MASTDFDIPSTTPRKSFWQTYLRPALRRLLWPRRKSYWADSPIDDIDEVSRMGTRFMSVVLLFVIQALVILLPAAYLVQIVFVVPGGLPGIIGQQLADVCLSGGSCDFDLLLAGYAFAIVFLINALALIVYGLASAVGWIDKDNTEDVVYALAVIDDRVCNLQYELVEAGVLPDMEEDDDDD